MKKILVASAILFLFLPILALAVGQPIYHVDYSYDWDETDFRFWNGSWQYNGGLGWGNVQDIMDTWIYDSRFEQIARDLNGRNSSWGANYFDALQANDPEVQIDVEYPSEAGTAETGTAGKAPSSAASAAQAQEVKPPNLKIQIGKTTLNFQAIGPCEGGKDSSYCIGWISQYVGVVYRYGVGLAAVLASVMIMVGGFLWLSSAGNPSQISKGKEFIISALTGLVLALFSFIILQTINPRLVALEPLAIKKIEEFGDSTPAKARQALAAREGTGGSGSNLDLWDPNHQDAVSRIGEQGGQSQLPTTYPGHDDATNSAGNATDVWPTDQASGDELATYIMENAENLGVSYVIWDQRIWNPNPHSQGSREEAPSQPGGDTVKPPSEWDLIEDRGSDTTNHRDHIHISFN